MAEVIIETRCSFGVIARGDVRVSLEQTKT